MPSSPKIRKSHPATGLASKPDLAIVGGGIVGLWCAQRASRLGLRTVLIEKGLIGQGASGGFLGALMPHQPLNWSPEKAFQLDALISLETEIASLQEHTATDCGYLRCGRLIPTRTNKKRNERARWQAAAEQHWPARSPGGAALSWRLLDTVPDAQWLNPEVARLGCEYDTLSARLKPRRLLTALASHIGNSVEVRQRTSVIKLENGGQTLLLSDGTTITPGHVIMAAGYETFELLRPVTGRVLGRGVKGQAALLRPQRPVDPKSPILYYAGVYVIAHDNGLVAVGSTSQSDLSDANSTDDKLDDVIARAAELCPELHGAETVERWAGVRPNAVGRHPMIGSLPDFERVTVCTGGFKISFGIAHKMADAALACVNGVTPEIPELFKVPSHYECADRLEPQRVSDRIAAPRF